MAEQIRQRAYAGLAGVNIASNGRLLRLGDIADVRRIYVDPPQPLFRVNGKPAIGLAIAMRDGGDILNLGRNIQRTMDEITADLPHGKYRNDRAKRLLHWQPRLLVDERIVESNGGRIGSRVSEVNSSRPGPIDRPQAHGARLAGCINFAARKLECLA